MPAVETRPFRRGDREQLTALVNAHVGAVVPGVSVSVNAVLGQLEREPEEALVDPWVVERATLVACRRDAVVAAAHLLRYADDERVGPSYRGSGEIRWLVARPDEPGAGAALAAAAVARLEEWRVARQWADGALPAPGCYGIPDCWPHVRRLLEDAGFVAGDRVEIVLAAAVADLPRAGEPPLPGLELRREVGSHATAFRALLGGAPVGLFEVRGDLTNGGALSRLAGWGDVWNLHVEEPLRRRGVGRWLVGCGVEWLRLGRVERLLAETIAGEEPARAFALAVGFRELVRTTRGWSRAIPPA